MIGFLCTVKDRDETSNLELKRSEVEGLRVKCNICFGLNETISLLAEGIEICEHTSFYVQ